MHILSSANRSEFLATPQLIRFDYVRGGNAHEPTLLIKGSTLLLKYIVLGVKMRLCFARIQDRLLYGLKVDDDPERGGVLWSLIENNNEKTALIAMGNGEPCQVFLFNELAVNVAWAELQINVASEIKEMTKGIATEHACQVGLEDEIALALRKFHEETKSSAGRIIADVPNSTPWKPIFSHFIKNQTTTSPISIFNKDEGGQQEQIGIWLTNNLHPLGVHSGPQIPKGKGYRELTDILLSHEFGSILIESKVLNIFARTKLPGRKKLAHDISSHIKKAIGQLRGGMRRLKDGAPVRAKNGSLLNIERSQPMHGIVLIPDLDLVENRNDYGIDMTKDFMNDTGGFLHIVDISELLRIVQAAEMIASRGNTTTPMMALDYYLIERAKKAAEAGTLCVEIFLRFVDE